MRTSALRMEDLLHYTYEDYAQWEGRSELIGGIPYAMTPTPVKKNQWISSKIIVQLGELLKDCGQCEILLPVDWPITFSDQTITLNDQAISLTQDRRFFNCPFLFSLFVCSG